MSAAEAATRGRFIVLDGVDGCGKSTQAVQLVTALAKLTGAAPLHVREPGSTRLGESLRALLLARESELDARVETLLFAAARAHMLRELVAPALAAGRHVVCERFHPSTFAYQAAAGGLPEGEVLELLETWAGSPSPDRVLLLDIDPGTALLRRGAARDRIEDKGLAFQQRVALGYRRYAELVRDTCVIDADRPADKVAADVLAEVLRALG